MDIVRGSCARPTLRVRAASPGRTRPCAMQLLSNIGTTLLDWGNTMVQPVDPLYETFTSKSGAQKRRRRPMPPGLSRSERTALAKVRRTAALAQLMAQVRMRAHFLDHSDCAKPHRSTALSVRWQRFLVSAGVLVHGRESIISVTGDVEDGAAAGS